MMIRINLMTMKINKMMNIMKKINILIILKNKMMNAICIKEKILIKFSLRVSLGYQKIKMLV
jgi:hypothetical protein